MKRNNTENSKKRRCTYCNAKEKELRLVGNFLVELTSVDIEGAEKFACQSCKVKVREAREAIQRNIGF